MKTKKQYKTVLEHNAERIDYMKETFGDKYLEMFGMQLEMGYSIQQAIDKCWEEFKPKEN